MKNFILLLFFLIGFTFYGNSQFCGTVESNIPITPTTTTQISPTYNSGRRAFNFVATQGCTYEFSTCGLSSVDTYLRLYSTGTGGDLITQNDDVCGLQSTITWTCPTSGTYSVHLSRWRNNGNQCDPLNGDTQLSYRIVSCPTPPNPTSISTNKESICILDTATLTVSGGVGTVHWFTGSCATSGSIGTGTTINVSPTITTTYFARNFNNGAWSTACAFIEIIVDDCTLPIELLSFIGKNITNYNNIEWVTASEINNDYFKLERSVDGENWEIINIQSGVGTSNQNNYYSCRDYDFRNVVNYYRLSQTDFDGTREYFNPISIDNRKESPYIVKTINIMGQEVDDSYTGVIIHLYSDGATEKVYKTNN
jgi:hypothetical protein